MSIRFVRHYLLFASSVLTCFGATVQYNTALEMPGLSPFPIAIFQIRTGSDGNLRVNFGSIASVSPSGALEWVWNPPLPDTVEQDAFEVGSDGSTYVLVTASPNAAGTTSPPFTLGENLARLDASGNLVAVMNIGDLLHPSAMAVDASSHVYLSGSLSNNGVPSHFTAKFDLSSGKILYMNTSIGVNSETNTYGEVLPGGMAVSPQGNLVLVSAGGSGAPAATPGSLQSSGSQWVAGLDEAGDITFVTYLGGTGMDVPSGVALDSRGDIYIAGTTQSIDYPTTSNAFQSEFPSLPIDVGNLAPPVGDCIPNQIFTVGCSFPGSPSPARGRLSGYLSILNPYGSSLLYSTYFGGSGATLLSSLALDEARGKILLAGVSNSSDLPGLAPGYSKCLPAVFGAGLTLDGSSLLQTVPVGFDFQPLPYQLETAPSFSETSSGALAIVSLSSPAIAIVNWNSSSPLACAASSADQAPTLSIAPGQLLTLFGSGFSDSAWAAQPVNGTYPIVSPDGVTVLVDGIPAPLLYTSPDQINLQVPFATGVSGLNIPSQTGVTGPATLTLQTASGQTVSQNLNVSQSNPRVFQSPLPFSECVSSWAGEMYTFATNADGTRNSCVNPAQPGSIVTVFVNGVGTGDGSEVTGGIIPQGATTTFTASIASTPTNPWSVVSIRPLSGSITGMYAVQIQVGSSGYDVDGPLKISNPQQMNVFTVNLLDIRVAPDATSAN